MWSLVTVITAASTYDLTALETVKDELDIPPNDGTKDAKLRNFIHQASGIFAAECDRVFAQETVTEQFDLPHAYSLLRLSRIPVASPITSLTVDGDEADAADYYVIPKTGELRNLDSGIVTDWAAGRIIVSYTGGYELLATLPFEIERAVISLVKKFYYASTRDPMLRSEEAPGIGSFSYRDDTKGYPAEFSAMVDKYRRMVA